MLSVNEAYQGRRFSTKKLLQYKNELAIILPRIKIPKGKLSITYIFGVSSKAADIDNGIKALQDSIAENYGFNDRIIYHLNVTKVDVAKGKEFIEFHIEALK